MYLIHRRMVLVEKVDFSYLALLMWSRPPAGWQAALAGGADRISRNVTIVTHLSNGGAGGL
jgi:hypothetical protein